MKILFWGALILPEKQKHAWGKTWVNSYHVLEIHSPLYLGLQPWAGTQAKKLKGTKRHFKFQVENCELSVCPDLCVSRCMSPSLGYPSWNTMYFQDLVDYFLSHVREVFSYYLFKYLLRSFLRPSGQCWGSRVCAKLLQSCLILCNPVGCSLLGSSVHEILQVRTLESVAMPSSRGSAWARD